MLAHVKVRFEGKVVGEFPLDKSQVTIGRKNENHIALKDAGVSRFHARISHLDGKYYLEDLGSAAGTIVNNIRVNQCELSNGDIIMLSMHTLHFCDPNQDDDDATILGGANQPVDQPAKEPLNPAPPIIEATPEPIASHHEDASAPPTHQPSAVQDDAQNITDTPESAKGPLNPEQIRELFNEASADVQKEAEATPVTAVDSNEERYPAQETAIDDTPDQPQASNSNVIADPEVSEDPIVEPGLPENSAVDIEMDDLTPLESTENDQIVVEDEPPQFISHASAASSVEENDTDNTFGQEAILPKKEVKDNKDESSTVKTRALIVLSKAREIQAAQSLRAKQGIAQVKAIAKEQPKKAMAAGIGFIAVASLAGYLMTATDTIDNVDSQEIAQANILPSQIDIEKELQSLEKAANSIEKYKSRYHDGVTLNASWVTSSPIEGTAEWAARQQSYLDLISTHVPIDKSIKTIKLKYNNYTTLETEGSGAIREEITTEITQLQDKLKQMASLSVLLSKTRQAILDYQKTSMALHVSESDNTNAILLLIDKADKALQINSIETAAEYLLKVNRFLVDKTALLKAVDQYRENALMAKLNRDRFYMENKLEMKQDDKIHQAVQHSMVNVTDSVGIQTRKNDFQTLADAYQKNLLAGENKIRLAKARVQRAILQKREKQAEEERQAALAKAEAKQKAQEQEAKCNSAMSELEAVQNIDCSDAVAMDAFMGMLSSRGGGGMSPGMSNMCASDKQTKMRIAEQKVRLACNSRRY